jgi:alpha-glucosidase
MHNDMLPGKFVDIDRKQNLFTVTTESQCAIQIIVLTDHIIRVRYATDGHFENDFSYAISSKFVPEYPEVILNNRPNHVELRTSALIVNMVNKTDSNISFIDIQGIDHMQGREGIPLA